MPTYKIVRQYFNNRDYPARVVRGKRGLTLEEAQRHCRNPETSSRTCTKAAGIRRTRERGPWFDSYTEE